MIARDSLGKCPEGIHFQWVSLMWPKKFYVGLCAGSLVPDGSTYEVLKLITPLEHIEVPDDLIQWVDVAQLPQDWAAAQAPAALRLFADFWSESQTSVALRVPGALSPVEFSSLIFRDGYL